LLKGTEMPSTWEKALFSYRYPVDLSGYTNAHLYPDWFTHELSYGDRTETSGFEAHFRNVAAQGIEPWLEVIYWKLYSQQAYRNSATKRVEGHLLSERINGMSLWNACNVYIQKPTSDNFATFRSMFGFTSNAIAVAATFPAFIRPDVYPMVDTRIAKWVGACMAKHNAADLKGPQLTRPLFLDNGNTVLVMNDFDFMQDWGKWCVHTAIKLKKRTLVDWRARDVEMAVFYSWGGRHEHHPCLHLNPLPSTD
jgi:hypothetical protein